MRLDYYTLLCPVPISLSIGTIKQPTLIDIGKLTYPRFKIYQAYLKLTPRAYYESINPEQGKKDWEILTDEQKQEVTLYDVIIVEEPVRYYFLEIFNFFFVERVIFAEDIFWILKTDDYETPMDEIELTKDNVKGAITYDTLSDVLDILQQVCCMKSSDPLDEEKPKFKNAKAKKLYEKMLKAKEDDKKEKEFEDFVNLTLGNIVSSTAAKSMNLNIINIWDATLFQLYDQFRRAQTDDAHYMNAVRVAVWGDEKNQFDPALWYKNTYDKQQNQDF